MTRADRGTNQLAASWEHIVPQAFGGKHDLANLVLAHRGCNSKRGRKPLKSHYQSYTLAQTLEGA